MQGQSVLLNSQPHRECQQVGQTVSLVCRINLVVSWCQWLMKTKT